MTARIQVPDTKYVVVQGGRIFYLGKARGTLEHAADMEILISVQPNGHYLIDVRPSGDEQP